MSEPTPHDVAMVLNRLALRVNREGKKALKITLSWADSIRAASYGEDQGGNRYSDCSNPPCKDCPHPMPQDPTGEGAINPDEVAQLHATLKKQLRTLLATAANVEHILDQADPDPTKHPRLPDAPLDESRWCTSCMQDRGRLHPVAVHSDGRVRFKGLCAWCHGFIADYGRRPTASLIAKHHTPYVHVTEGDVLRALGIGKKVKA